MRKTLFRDTVREVLPPDAKIEPPEDMNISQIAFWVKEEGTDRQVRYNRKSRDVYIDGEDMEVQWLRVGESICERIVDTRSALKWIGLGGPAPSAPDLHMPDGAPMKRVESNDAYLIMTKEGLDVRDAVERRTADATVRILTDRAAIVKNAMIIRQSPLRLDYTIETLPNAVIPVEKAKDLYKRALDTIINKHAILGDEHMTEEERALVGDLTEFLRTCEWGTVRDDVMYAQTETRGGGRIGGAMFVVPRGSWDEPTHYANRNEEGLPYLSIRNDDITFPWAALTLAKQSAVMMHFAKIGTAKETRTQYLDNDRESTQIEIALANVLSKGMFKKAAKTIARGLKTEHTDGQSFVRAVDALFHSDEDLDRITASIDQCIEPQHPKSKAEMRLRHGFHRIAVMFAVADEASDGNVRRANMLKNEIVDFCYRDMGAGDKVPREAAPDHESN